MKALSQGVMKLSRLEAILVSMDTTPTRHSLNVVWMLDQRLQRCPNI